MVLGKYNSKYKIYQFGGKWFTPRWFANATTMRIDECKPILEAGYSAGKTDRQRAILLAGLKQWKAIQEAGFSSWYGLAQLHCYDDTVNAGTVPNWARSFAQMNGFLIHEYSPGKVALMMDEADLGNKIYEYFEDAAEPDWDEDTTGTNTGGTSGGGASTGGTNTGGTTTPTTATTASALAGLLAMNSKTCIKWEVVGGKVVPTEITVEPLAATTSGDESS